MSCTLTLTNAHLLIAQLEHVQQATYLVEVDLGLGVGCWDCGGREATRGRSSQCGESPQKNGAEHDAAVLPLRLRTKPCVCQSSRRSHVSPGSHHYPPPRLAPCLESTHSKINNSLSDHLSDDNITETNIWHFVNTSRVPNNHSH